MNVFNNKPLHIISYGCAMAQAVSYLEHLVSTPGKSTWSCVGQIVTGTGFIQVLQFSCTTLIYTMLHSYSFIYHQHLAVESIIKQHTSKTHYLSACLKVCGLKCFWLPLFAYIFLTYYLKNNFSPFLARLWNNWATNGQIFTKFHICVFFLKTANKIKVLLKSDKNYR